MYVSVHGWSSTATVQDTVERPVYTEHNHERERSVRIGLRINNLYEAVSRWSYELFLVNQSVLLFSWNSAQVSRDENCMGGSEAPLLGGDICHKYDATVKSGVHIYPCVSSSFSSSV